MEPSKSETKAEQPREQYQYTIGGVPVSFPCKPYPSQMAMMAKIVRALENKENALLESPTGSGKSLALLCASLAWQKQMHEKIFAEKSKAFAEFQELAASQQSNPKLCQCQCHLNMTNTPSVPLTVDSGYSSSLSINMLATPCSSTVTAPSNILTTPSNSVVTSEGTPSNQKELSVPPDQGGSIVECCEHVTTDHCCKAAVSEEKPAVKCEGESEQQQQQSIAASTSVIKNDEDDDFEKPKKKLRSTGRKKKAIVYDDDDSVEDKTHDQSACTTQQETDSSGRPLWKMTLVNQGGQDSTVHSPGPMNVSLDINSSTCRTTTTTEVKVDTACTQCTCGALQAKQEKLLLAAEKKVPVIFFGTRTHKQIAQITHELKKTAYAKTPMSILASREHTCVHPYVSLSKNKNEDCQKMVDPLRGHQCSYYHSVSRYSTQASIKACGLDTAWDIEDLVELGKKRFACPYFITRGLKDEAMIVFCPYNYLVDPMVTAYLDLHLENQVVILDEGHNVEDTARDGASYTVTMLQLQQVVDEVQEILSSSMVDYDLVESYKAIMLVCNKYIDWMKENEVHLPQHMYEQACKVWHGTDMLEEMKHKMDIKPTLFEVYKVHLKTLVTSVRDPMFMKSRQERKKYKEGLIPTISMSTLAIVENLFIVLDFLFNYTSDYRVALMKTTAFKYEPELDGGWNRRQRRRGTLQKVWTISLNFWCLNPAVAFSGFSSTRCVILTSGTLSPMLSFSSELGTKFPIQLEANHVIHSSQVWIGTLSAGPNGRQLCASYQNTESFEFQDELGHLILNICKTIPYGVLCFFTSYKMLEKLSNRWKAVGIWDMISERKAIVCEPRAGDKADFERSMMTFYEAVSQGHHCYSNGNGDGRHGIDGALFLAVCRGKVSEGLDFIDNNARAVITVGIPYPYVKDKQVELKREYNNNNCARKGLLNGGEWYEIQAYRALNQALGRCIRHKKDWGALVLVDERFSKSDRYTRGLSKWVRQGIKHHTDFSAAQMSLKFFANSRLDPPSTPQSTLSESKLGPQSTPFMGSPYFNTSNSVTAPDASANLLQSPPTPGHQPAADKACMPGTTPVRMEAIASPVLSPQTLQVLDPKLTGLVKEQLKMACMRLFNTNQYPVTTSTPAIPPTVEPVAAVTELPTVSPPVDNELTMIIPASPPMLVAPQESSRTPSLEGSPPLIGSPCKQPLTSSTHDHDTTDCSYEGKGPLSSLIVTPSCHAAETVDLTADIKELQHDTVESSSPRSIVLPSNSTPCSNKLDPVTTVDEVTPVRSRLLRKRKAKQQSTNVRLTAKRQHGKQQESVMMKEYSANCSGCGIEMAKLRATNEKEFSGANLIPQLQHHVTDGNESLLIDWLNNSGVAAQRRGNHLAFIVPSSQVSTLSHLMLQGKGLCNSVWDCGTGLVYRPISCTCNDKTIRFVQLLAANKQEALEKYVDKTIVLSAGVNIVTNKD